jgi:hypothetical protein
MIVSAIDFGVVVGVGLGRSSDEYRVTLLSIIGALIDVRVIGSEDVGREDSRTLPVEREELDGVDVWHDGGGSKRAQDQRKANVSPRASH